MVGWYDATPEKCYEMIDIICVIRDTGSLSEGEKNGREHEQLKQLIVNNYPFKRSSNACHSWFLFFSQVEILTRIKDPATRKYRADLDCCSLFKRSLTWLAYLWWCVARKLKWKMVNNFHSH